jgi:hypothetical protein
MPSWTNNIIFPGGRTDPEIRDAEDDLTPDEFDRQYGAMFVERSGRVMAEWDDEVHIKDLEIHRRWPLYLCIDFGYTNDWVLLAIQVDDENNVYVMREKRWRFKDTEVIAKEAYADPVWGPIIRQAVAFYPDPASPDDAAILTRHWRLHSRGNTGGEVSQRIRIMRSALRRLTPDRDDIPDSQKWPGLVVDRSCTMLQWEMREGWRWPEHKSEVKNESENPLDKDNHGPEALGRFFRGYFGVIDQKKRGSRQRRAKIRR